MDVEELEANKEPSEESEKEVEEVKEDFNNTIFGILKEHAVDLFTRLKPTKKTYQHLMWEDFTPEDLLNQKMENVFQNDLNLMIYKKGES